MNCVGSSEYTTVFTSFTRASFLNMRADKSSVRLIRTAFSKSTILYSYSMTFFQQTNDGCIRISPMGILL